MLTMMKMVTKVYTRKKKKTSLFSPYFLTRMSG